MNNNHSSNQSSNDSSLFRTYMILAFALILMIVCWENNRGNTAIAATGIPQESIRLRILANSDDPMDQYVKREIRDAVIEQIGQWSGGPQTLDQARVTITTHLPEIRDLIAQELEKRGYDYGYHVELGQVPFPAKMYGGQVYPAGDYEALRITLGKGEGQNWWCVLFPPLCFVDVVSGDAVVTNKESSAVKTASAKQADTKSNASSVNAEQKAEDTSKQSVSKKNEAADSNKEASTKRGGSSNKDASASSITGQSVQKIDPNPANQTDQEQESSNSQSGKSGERQYRFFLWDWIKSLFA